MREILDKELKGVAMILDSPLDAVAWSAKAQTDPSVPHNLNIRPKAYSYHTEGEEAVYFRTWRDVELAFHKPWKWGTKRVNQMLDELRSVKLPEPKDRRRKARWSEDRGDIDVDRAMIGEPTMFREVRRTNVKGPTSVALLCNLDASWGGAEAVLWRGAVGIACADLLEQNGYSCEIWMWCRGYSVYAYPYDEQFHTCCMKKQGEPMDIDAIIKGLSQWFLWLGLFASFVGAKTNKAVGIGGKHNELGGWRKYMDITEGIKEVQVPVHCYTQQAAIMAAVKVLTDLENQQQDDF